MHIFKLSLLVQGWSANQMGRRAKNGRSEVERKGIEGERMERKKGRV